MRDLGGLPTETGETVRPRRLLRSDNLQDLSPEAIETLVTHYGVSDVVDLRTHVELAKEGDGPLRALVHIRHHHHTLYREDSIESGIPAAERALPWETDERREAAAARRAARSPTARQRRRTAAATRSSGRSTTCPTSRRGPTPSSPRSMPSPRARAPPSCTAPPARTARAPSSGSRSRWSACPTTSSSPTTPPRPSGCPRSWRDCARARRMPPTCRTRPSPSSPRRPTRCGCCSAALEERHGGVLGWLGSQGWTDADTDRLRRKLLATEGSGRWAASSRLSRRRCRSSSCCPRRP